jgi:hypothetical protein
VISGTSKRKGVESSAVLESLSCNRAIVIPTVKSGIKRVKNRVAESVNSNKYRQHGTILQSTFLIQLSCVFRMVLKKV